MKPEQDTGGSAFQPPTVDRDIANAVETVLQQDAALRAENETNRNTLCALTTLLFSDRRGCWTEGMLTEAVNKLRSENEAVVAKYATSQNQLADALLREGNSRDQWKAENARQAAEIAAKDAALRLIASYGADGICPYGCDTPHIAAGALSDPTPGWLPPEEAAKLRAELATAREDSARLDWLMNWNVSGHPFKNRAAIDAARNAGAPVKCRRCEGTGNVPASREACATEEITCPDCKGGNAGGAA